MAQLLKTKNINVILGQSSCRQCKAKFLLEKCNLLQILIMNPLNVKHQGKNLTQVSNQLAFQQSVYTQYLSTAE